MATGRFAPSPSGPLHLGSLRTAMVAWLFARSSGGGFLMRIEDLNPATASPEHERVLLADLIALGVDWDGPVVRQSERRAVHDAAVAELVAMGRTYPCFCSRREIRESAAAPHEMLALYPGTCRDLTPDEVQARVDSGRPAALRLRTAGEVVTIEDRLRGQVTAPVDDIVLRRNDGVPAYHVAVIVDDDDQGVDEVVRGDDLLPVTPSQAHLLDLLGRRRPGWAHVSLAVGTDGIRLAKRHGSVTMAELAGQGVGPDAVRNRLAVSLGLAEPGEPTTMSLLLERFDPDRLPTEPWVVT
ncbi:MAG: tRNA glutamyl-Q(34) synthetase GluQRS [Acidimicrobiales bacterium]